MLRMRYTNSGMLLLAIAIGLTSSTGLVLAQSNIDPANKYAWCENVGWTNWRDANGANDGVVVDQTYLSGYIWGENTGWITVGNGAPADGVHYANVDDTDFGVNIDGNDDLYGLGWGENIGWINFDTRAALSPFGQQARLDTASDRFRGYAWGENVGWINLDDATHFVAYLVPCPGDLDGNGFRDFTDFNLFATAYGSQAGDPNWNPDADLNGDGHVDFTDFNIFASVYGVPCP